MCATRRARAQASLPAGQQPAPMNAVNDAIRSLQLAPADTIADLGCGDGRALIAAVQSSGCRAVGVEIDSERAELARRNVDAAGLSDKITIFTGDATDFDLQGAGVTHVYLYLFSDLLEKLSPKLKGYPVASAFHEIPGWSGKKVGSVWAYNI